MPFASDWLAVARIIRLDPACKTGDTEKRLLLGAFASDLFTYFPSAIDWAVGSALAGGLGAKDRVASKVRIILTARLTNPSRNPIGRMHPLCGDRTQTYEPLYVLHC